MSQPNAGDTSALIGGSFTETHPNTNDFYVALNGGIYGGTTAGQTNTASPANQLTTTTTTLDGNDYVSKIKIVHADDFGQSVTNENVSPTTSYQYVKPYTPATPTVDNPVFGAVNVTINKNSSETDGLEYAIFEVSQNKYVQANGSLGASAIWQTLGTSFGQWGFTSGTSGQVTVSGLANDSYTYQFKTVSRNTSDTLHAASSESALSGGASSANQSPVIVLGVIGQTTDGTKYVTINYTGSDLESENADMITAQYSVNGTNWFSMTEKAGVGSDGTVGLTFARTGTAHDLMWDVDADFPNSEDSTVYIRLQANDGTTSGAIVTSDPFTVDIKNPVTSAATAVQNADSGFVTITYTLGDLSNSTVEIDISEDGGANWTVVDTSLTGEVGDNIAPGTDKVIIWNALADFANQEQSDLRVQVRAIDNFGNVGANTSSSNFDLDTKAPSVSNVTAVQDAGLNTVTINYDLVDGHNSTVTIAISEDNGLTWGVATSTLAGDVGTGVSSGAGKIVTWNAATDFPNREQSGMKVRVQATDTFANASGDVASSAFAIDTRAPVISNVSAAQTISTDNVVFTYDLADSGLSTVALDISDDSGATWAVVDTSVVGQVGAGISAGNNKTITWSAGVDAPGVDLGSFRVRVRGIDPYQNSSSNVSSIDFALDTLAPAVNVVSDVILQPQAGDSSILVGGSFTETNPNTNSFYLNLNNAGYAGATAGTVNTATPANQLVTVGATLDGNDYVSAVKIEHTDDFAHLGANENTGVAPSKKFVKPYTPATPNVSNPQNNSVDVLVVPYILEAAGLEYAIYESTTDSYVQADGSLGLAEQWQTTAVWGTTTVIGLSSPVANYNFRVKSRNISDLSNALSSESDFSNVGAISNTAPSISFISVAQELSSNYVLIDYTGTDSQNDTNNLTAFEYSVDNVAWNTMTENTDVGSDGTTDLLFNSVGTEYLFAWDTGADLPNFGDATVYVRLQSNDGLTDSNLATSSAFSVDTLGPVITNIRTSQAPGSHTVTILYDLADDTAGNNTIDLVLSDDSGSTWTVPLSTLAGDIGAGVSAGVNRTVTWNAGVDFNNQENSTMRVSVQGTDSFDNLGGVALSSDFTVDTDVPVASAVSATQTIGTGNVVINYTIADLSAGGLTTNFELSQNNGVTWDVVATNFSGEIGAAQTTGTKTFTWNAGVDFAGQFESDMKARVRALDYFGNQGIYSVSPAFTLDTKAPSMANISGSQTLGTSLVDIGYDLSDDSDISDVGLQISQDGGLTWNVATGSATGDVDDLAEKGVGNLIVWNAGVDFAGHDSSNLRVQLIGTDDFGNISLAYESADFAVDTASPIGLAGLSKFASTDTSVTLVWSAATDANFDHYELWYGNNQSDVQTRSGSASSWAVAQDVELSNALTISTVISGITLNSDLYVKIWAVDEFGHEATTGDINVFEASEPVIIEGTGGPSGALDTVAPRQPVLQPVSTPTNQTVITISGLTSPLAQVDLYDGEVLLSRFGNASDFHGIFSQEFNFAEGVHRLIARAIDSAGNVSEPSAQISFEVDVTAPDRPIIANLNNIEITESKPMVVGSAEANATIELVIDGDEAVTVPADSAGNWRYLLPDELALSMGTHQITARATDLAGNIGQSSVWLFSVVRTAEAISEVAPIVIPGQPEVLPLVIPIVAPLSPIAQIIQEEAQATELSSLPTPVVELAAAVHGRNLEFSGQALPDSDVVVYIHSSQALIYQTKSDQNGDWNVVHSQDVTELSPGEHSIYAVAIDPEANVKSSRGQVSIFTVEKNIWVTLFGYLNLQTTLITLGVLLLSLVWLYRMRKGGKI